MQRICYFLESVDKMKHYSSRHRVCFVKYATVDSGMLMQLISFSTAVIADTLQHGASYFRPESLESETLNWRVIVKITFQNDGVK